MLKSHEITEVVQSTHSLLWGNGISAKVEYLGNKISSFNFFNDDINLLVVNIQDVDNFFYNMREELKHKMELNSLEDIKNFNSFDKLFGVKSNMLFDMNCKVLCTYMDVTLHCTLRLEDLEKFLQSNDQINSLFEISGCNEIYNYEDDSNIDDQNENVYVNVIKVKFASDEAMIKVLGTNDARKLEFVDRTKISNIILESLKMGS